MIFPTEKEYKKNDNNYLNTAIGVVYEDIKNNKHLEDYADTVVKLKLFYKYVTDKRGLCNTFINMAKAKHKVNTTKNMVMQDILNVLLTDKQVEFSKYTYLDNSTYQSSAVDTVKLVQPATNDNLLTVNSEFEVLMKKGGVKLVVEMLYVYLKSR